MGNRLKQSGKGLSHFLPRCHCTQTVSLLSFTQRPRFLQQRPNPSIERTRSGSAGLAFISFWAKPAPPPRAVHVKR